jgi:hypothetical protein
MYQPQQGAAGAPQYAYAVQADPNAAAAAAAGGWALQQQAAGQPAYQPQGYAVSWCLGWRWCGGAAPHEPHGTPPTRDPVLPCVLPAMQAQPAQQQYAAPAPAPGAQQPFFYHPQ